MKTIFLPIKAKTKTGNDIRKLPAAYPVIKEMEDEFKQFYRQSFNNIFLKDFVKKLNEKVEK